MSFVVVIDCNKLKLCSHCLFRILGVMKARFEGVVVFVNMCFVCLDR